MIRRLPKDKKPKEPFWQRITLRSVGKVAAGAIALEVGFLLTSYLTWRRINVDPQFRYDLHTGKYWSAGSYMLSGYYKMGETMDSSLDQRKLDLAYWRSLGKDV